MQFYPAYQGYGPIGSVTTMNAPNLSGASASGSTSVPGDIAKGASRSETSRAVDAAFGGLLNTGVLGSSLNVLGNSKSDLAFGKKRSFHRHPGLGKKNSIRRWKKKRHLKHHSRE